MDKLLRSTASCRKPAGSSQRLCSARWSTCEDWSCYVALVLLSLYIRTTVDVCFTAWLLVNIQILATSPAVKQIGLTWWKMFSSGWQLDLSPQARKSMTRRILCKVKRISWTLARTYRSTVCYKKQIPSSTVSFSFQ